MSQELKPCPFCAATPNTTPTIEQVEYNSWTASINCDNCDISMTPQFTELSEDAAIYCAVELWNRRPPEQSRGDEARDAARWRETVRRVAGRYSETGDQRFVLPSLFPVTLNIMQGSVAEHFTKAIDAALSRSALGREDGNG